MDRENIVLCARSTSVRESIHDQEKNYSGRLIFISMYVCWNMMRYQLSTWKISTDRIESIPEHLLLPFGGYMRDEREVETGKTDLKL